MCIGTDESKRTKVEKVLIFIVVNSRPWKRFGLVFGDLAQDVIFQNYNTSNNSELSDWLFFLLVL